MEENKGLEDERITLVDERESSNRIDSKSTDAQSRRRLSDELECSIINKEMVINELYSDMQVNGVSPAPPEVSLPSVGDAEKRVRSLERLHGEAWSCQYVGHRTRV